MNYSYRLHPFIRDDYVEAYLWYEAKQRGLGKRFAKEVSHTTKRIMVNPEAFRCLKRGFREARVDSFPYLVVYNINKKRNTVLISAIHHIKKHPRKKYRKE